MPESLDCAADALNRVQLAFFATFNDTDAVNYFYEPFLEAFDPELRKQLGVWYTPREIVRYMVERVDHLLRTELGEPRGLASSNVQVLDPCCGTGAYLVEVLARIHRTLREEAGDDDALVPADLRRAATTRIFGFEILPAPFVIAHLQISNLLEDAGASLAESQRALVFLTNALTGWVPVRHPQSNFGFPAFAEERDAAERVKQADTILVILGNPPYNGYAGIAPTRTGEGGSEERDLTLAYASPCPDLPAPQGQGLNDLYIRFFRVAERRITQNRAHRGIVSFISNYSWLDGLSHPTMRHHLLRSFNDVYIDNLHGDRRTSEYAPDGRTSETVFAMQGSSVGIKVGTAVSTLVKTGLPARGTSILYRDFEDARAHERREHLFASRYDHTTYTTVTPNPRLGLPFKPRTVTVSYLAWPRLPELFPVSFPGVQTGRDAFLIDIDRSDLESRMSRYFDTSVPNNVLSVEIPSAMENSARFDSEQVRDRLKSRGFRRWQVLRCGYRPFDDRWMYWEPTTKLLDEKRSEYVEQYATDSPAMLLAQSNRRSFDPPVYTTALATRHLVERGGNAFSLLTYTSGLLEDRRRFNLSYEADASITRVAGVAGDLFFHALATMHSPRYRTENAGALLGDWPRIPLPATAELLAHSAALGCRLAELLDPESEVELRAEWSFLARLVLPPELPEGTPDRDARNRARLAITAGWGGAGQGSTVMPRRGDARERPWTELERSRIATLAGTLSLEPETALDLLGEHCVDVYLNANTLWAAVPVRVWEYTLGGYQVLKKWLSYREESLLYRPLREEEARYFAQVVRRIAAILLLGPALDASYSAILPGATGLPKEQMLSRQLLPRSAEENLQGNLQGIGEL